MERNDGHVRCSTRRPGRLSADDARIAGRAISSGSIWKWAALDQAAKEPQDALSVERYKAAWARFLEAAAEVRLASLAKALQAR